MSAGYYFLTLDGITNGCGVLKSCSPEMHTADVIKIPDASGMLYRKTPGNLQMTKVTATMGAEGVGKEFAQWWTDSLQAKCRYVGGKVDFGDYSLKIVQTFEFREALLTSLKFPDCDSASKDAGMVEFEYTPEYCRLIKGNGSLDKGTINAAQKQWQPSNFKLSVDKVGADACAKVFKVAGMKMTQKTATDYHGPNREGELLGAAVDFDDVTVTIAMVNAEPWYKWHEDMVILGKTDESSAESGGAVEYLSTDLQKTLMTVNFHGMGIFKIAQDKQDKDSKKGMTVTATCYIQGMDIVKA